jgi:hypothetical protein
LLNLCQLGVVRAEVLERLGYTGEGGSRGADESAKRFERGTVQRRVGFLSKGDERELSYEATEL